LRLEAVRKLGEAGIPAGVFAMPVLPGLTDREEDLDALARAAKDAGAQWFIAGTLFLMPASWKSFFTFLEEKFPRLAARYREMYRGYGYAPENYRKEISRRAEDLRRKYGLGGHPETVSRRAHNSAQMQLTWGDGEERCQE
jgi:DNA repair photolyase